MTVHTIDEPARHHVIIAGTGRSGTTFLVRYLAALGLETHIAQHDGSEQLDEHAQAGLEDYPADANFENLPYVIKNPALYEFIEQLLSNKTIVLDAVIIPVRNLREAASSRVILERRARYQTQSFLAFMDKAWDSGGGVPGGIVYSINALDQARTLAVGFHLLIERLVQADVPMIFVDFPRIVVDAAYLYRKLAEIHPALADEAAALCAHRRVAKQSMVRTEGELDPGARLHDELDVIALRRELARLRAEHSREIERTRVEERAATARDCDQLEHQLNADNLLLRGEVERLQIEITRVVAQRAEIEVRNIRDEQRQVNLLSTLEAQTQAALKQTNMLAIQLNAAHDELNAILRSRSWRLTLPLRLGVLTLRKRLRRKTP